MFSGQNILLPVHVFCRRRGYN